MTSQDHDTDPSTPGAKRFSDPRTLAAASVALADDGPPMSGPRQSRLNTDPGIAPEAEPLAVPRHRMGVVVPPVAPRPVAPRPSDSVDMLLEGIRREQPDRPRTTPQTDGQAAATYHAEHAVRAAQTSPDDEPKVVVDRPPLAETLQISRDAVPGAGERQAWTETTAVSAQPLGARVTVAVVAGLAVVALIFVALERTTGQRSYWEARASRAAVAIGLAPKLGSSSSTMPQAPPAAPASATPLAPAAPPAAVAPVAPPVVASGEADPVTSAAAPAPAPQGPSHASASPASAASPPAKSAARPRPRPAPSPAKPRASELGEFKASY